MTCTIIASIILVVLLLFVCSIVIVFGLPFLATSIGDAVRRITSGLEQP